MIEKNSGSNLEGIVLAAGFSSRAGEFKPLMDFHGEPAILVVVRKLREVCKDVIVVTGHRSSDIVGVVDLLQDPFVKCVVNREYECGMFSSIQTGVRALSDGSDFFLQMVDQPHVPQSVYRTLTEAMTRKYDVFIPVYHGQRGHPLLCRSGLRAVISSASPDSTLRDALRTLKDRTTEVAVDTDAVLHTINTPADRQFITTHYC